MERKSPVSQKANQPSPAESHRQQMLRQVWLPLAVSLLIFLALVALTLWGAVKGSPQITKWGNLSAIYVILPVLFAALVILALLAACIYGMVKLLKAMPGWMLIVQAFMQRVYAAVRQASDAAVRPVFSAQANSARARSFWKQIFH